MGEEATALLCWWWIFAGGGFAALSPEPAVEGVSVGVLRVTIDIRAGKLAKTDSYSSASCPPTVMGQRLDPCRRHRQHRIRQTWPSPCCWHCRSQLSTKRTFFCRLLSAMTASMASAIFWSVCDPLKAWNASKRETGSPHRKAWTVTPRNACGDLLPSLALPLQGLTSLARSKSLLDRHCAKNEVDYISRLSKLKLNLNKQQPLFSQRLYTIPEFRE